jgi:hypothetical protein
MMAESQQSDWKFRRNASGQMQIYSPVRITQSCCWQTSLWRKARCQTWICTSGGKNINTTGKINICIGPVIFYMGAFRWSRLAEIDVYTLFLFMWRRVQCITQRPFMMGFFLPSLQRQNCSLSVLWGFLSRRSSNHTCCWQLWVSFNIVICFPKCLRVFEHRFQTLFSQNCEQL